MSARTCAELGVCKAASPACVGCTPCPVRTPAPITLEGPYYPKRHALHRLGCQLRSQLRRLWRYLAGPSPW